LSHFDTFNTIEVLNNSKESSLLQYGINYGSEKVLWYWPREIENSLTFDCKKDL